MNDDFPKVTAIVDSRGRVRLFIDGNEFYYDIFDIESRTRAGFTTLAISMPVSTLEIRTVD